MQKMSEFECMMSAVADDFKDAEILHKYAEQVEEEGKHDLAVWFSKKAHKRIEMFELDHEAVKKFMAKETDDLKNRLQRYGK